MTVDGFHVKAGEEHAEVIVLKKAGMLARDSEQVTVTIQH